ncbi:MAG: PAS domain S-box protein [Thermodesulfovibrionales bacterium]|jgi:PAS domain S-box-containing protein
MNIKEEKKVENQLAEEAARLRQENALLKDDLERLKHTHHSARKPIKDSILKESLFRNLIIQNAAEGLSVCHNIPGYPYVFFTIWNPRMTEITGYTIREINKKGWYQTMYPDTELQARAHKRMERMRQGEDMRREAWEITRSDGEKRIVSITTSILEEDDKTVHVLALMNDITERKLFEKEIKKREEELNKRVKELEEFYNMAVGREIRMIQMKKEMEKLRNELAKYKNQ